MLAMVVKKHAYIGNSKRYHQIFTFCKFSFRLGAYFGYCWGFPLFCFQEEKFLVFICAS